MILCSAMKALLFARNSGYVLSAKYMRVADELREQHETLEIVSKLDARVRPICDKYFV